MPHLYLGRLGLLASSVDTNAEDGDESHDEGGNGKHCERDDGDLLLLVQTAFRVGRIGR